VAIRNGSLVFFSNWGHTSAQQVLLNSHTVAAPLSRTQQEVSGYINYNIGMEPDVG
jgi:hypothetical protein